MAKQVGPSATWWVENTGVAPAPGVPFPAESFPRYTRKGMRSLWNDAAKAGGAREDPWSPYFTSHKEYIRARRASAEWSAEHSKQALSAWKPESGPRETRAYYDAYPADLWTQLGLPLQGRRRGSPWHKHYVVTVGGFMTEDEYDTEYPLLD